MSNKANGFVRALSSGEDLDTLFDIGGYYATDEAASSILHTPYTFAYHLYVLRADNDTVSVKRTVQIAIPTAPSNISIQYRKHNSHGWSEWIPFAIQYTSLEQIGLSAGTETIEAIASALPDRSTLEYEVYESNNREIYPDYGGKTRIGICRVVKLSDSRISFEFTIKADNHYTPKRWLGFYSKDAKWIGWQRLATAEEPEWYEIEVTSNYTKQNGPYYCKDGSGTVWLTGVLSRQGTPEKGEVILTLPEGFRPTQLHPLVLTAAIGDDGAPWSTYAYINTQGKLLLHTGAIPAFEKGNNFIFSTSFPAKQQGS